MSIGRFGPIGLRRLNGQPLTNHSLQVFEAGTTTPATLFADLAGTTPLPNPVNTDAFGNVTLCAEAGMYDLLVNGARIQVPIDGAASDSGDGGSGGPAVTSGDLSARPAADAGAVNTMYYASDVDVLAICVLFAGKHQWLELPKDAATIPEFDWTDIDVTHPGMGGTPNPDVVVTGTWEPQGGTGYYPHTDGAYVMACQTPGGSIAVAFTGTAIRWYGRKSDYAGIAEVTLDGGAPFDVDLYVPTAETDTGHVIYERLDLAPGEHTLTLAYAGRKNPASNMEWVYVDYFSAGELA